MSDFKKRNFDVITITPAMARKILDDHTNYRKVSKRRIDAYVRIMKADKWELAQPIMFDEEGILIDGQHRLLAVIETGESRAFVVICGLPRRAMRTIDSGQVRTSNQVLAFERGDVSHRTAGVIRGVLSMPSTHTGVIQNSELPELYDKLEPYLFTLKQLIPQKQKGFCRAPFQAAVVRCLMRHEDSLEIVSTLIEEMQSAKFKNSKNGGILSRMLLTEPATGNQAAVQIYLKSARALKAEISGVELNKLYIPSEDPFPLPDAYKGLI